MSFKTIWQFFSRRFNKNYLKGVRAAKRQRDSNPQPCIRCAKCVPVCPANLLPQQLVWHIQGQDLEQANKTGLLNCIECRLCEQVCPSDIPLVSFYQTAKLELAQQATEKISADNAKRLFLEKQARLADKLLRAQQKQDDVKATLDRVMSKIQ